MNTKTVDVSGLIWMILWIMAWVDITFLIDMERDIIDSWWVH